MIGANRRAKAQAEIRIAPVERLKRFAASAWAISFVSFAVTVVVLQSPGLSLA
jgi:hypothetical protein